METILRAIRSELNSRGLSVKEYSYQDQNINLDEVEPHVKTEACLGRLLNVYVVPSLGVGEVKHNLIHYAYNLFYRGADYQARESTFLDPSYQLDGSSLIDGVNPVDGINPTNLEDSKSQEDAEIDELDIEIEQELSSS